MENYKAIAMHAGNYPMKVIPKRNSYIPAVIIFNGDIPCLEKQAFPNENIINGILSDLVFTKFSNANERCRLLSSYSFFELKACPNYFQEGEFDCFVPVNVAQWHWVALVVFRRERLLMILDSNLSPEMNLIHGEIFCAAQTHLGGKWATMCPQVAQQGETVNCGLYVIRYGEIIFECYERGPCSSQEVVSKCDNIGDIEECRKRWRELVTDT